MTNEVDPQQRFALQARNVHLGWLTLAISWMAAVVAATHERYYLCALALSLGFGVFRVTQRNRLEQRNVPVSRAMRFASSSNKRTGS